VISWYVLFTMIQQGLNQVRDVKKAQLQATLTHVERHWAGREAACDATATAAGCERRLT